MNISQSQSNMVVQWHIQNMAMKVFIWMRNTLSNVIGHYETLFQILETLVGDKSVN